MTEQASLPAFPVDDVTLALVEHAMGARLIFDGTEDGPKVVGADMSMPALLDFLSGYDPAKVVPLVLEDGHEVDGWTEYVGGPIYGRDDIIAALIAEVRRLRPSDDA